MRYSLKVTLAVVLALILPRIIWLACCALDLYGDEAQYWTWSRDLAFGYYSKPPLIAWLIALTTAVGGDGEFWVRLASPLLHIGTALFFYGIGRRLFDRRVGFWSAVVFATMPGALLSSLVITTDAPLFFFFAGGLYAVVRALRDERNAWWLLVGVCFGLGLLSKYAMAFFGVSLVLLWVYERRRWSPGAFRGMAPALLLGLLILLPNLLWNAEHDYPTVVHTVQSGAPGRKLFTPLKGLEFLGSQFFVFGFFIITLAIAILFRWRDVTAHREESLLRLFVLPPLIFYIPLAFVRGAYANWAAAAYVGATVLIVPQLFRRGLPQWLLRGVVAHYAIAIVLTVVPHVAVALGSPLPAKLDPWKRMRGWAEVGAEVSRLRGEHPGAALMNDRRLYMGSLLYYVRPFPDDAVQWNLDGQVEGYELTRDLRHSGAEEFLFVTERTNPADLLACWDASDRLEDIRVPITSDRDRVFRVYLLRGFRGDPEGR